MPIFKQISDYPGLQILTNILSDITMSIFITKKQDRDNSDSNSQPPSQFEVIISSEEISPEHQDHPQQDPTELQPISQPADEEEENRQRQIKINNAVQQLKEIQAKRQRETQEFKEILAKKASKEQERMIQKQLKKQFEAHSYLPMKSLENVRHELAKFQKYCRFEEQPEAERPFTTVRQQNRRLLTRAMLLSIQQIRMKIDFEQQTQTQKKLLQEMSDTLLYCYQLASKMEGQFFKRIFKSQQKSSGQHYQKQIKIILRQFSDKNNIDFRRNVINVKISNKELAKADDQSLKCQKTKEEQQAKLQQLIRQSEKDPQIILQIESEEDLQPRLNQLHSLSSLGNLPEPMEEEKPQETDEEKRIREKGQLMIKARKIYKKCELTMKQHQEKMVNRMQQLKYGHEKNIFFTNLCTSLLL